MSEALLTEEFDAQVTALEDFDVSSAKLMQADKHWEFFARLRDEAPVHYCKDSMFGPYWSITRFADIMEIEKNWQDFSSDLGITLTDRPEDFSTPNFIGMDPPKHDQQRQTVQGYSCIEPLKPSSSPALSSLFPETLPKDETLRSPVDRSPVIPRRSNSTMLQGARLAINWEIYLIWFRYCLYSSMCISCLCFWAMISIQFRAQ